MGKIAIQRIVDRDHAFSVEVKWQHCSEGEPCHAFPWQTLTAHTEPQHRCCFCRVSPHLPGANFHNSASPLRKKSRRVFVQINSQVRVQPEKIFGQLNHHLTRAAYSVRFKIWGDDIQKPLIVLHRSFVWPRPPCELTNGGFFSVSRA